MRSSNDILIEIKETERKLAELNAELLKARQSKSRSSSESYEKRKKLLEESRKIFEKILSPGDFVKVTGSKASSYRKVVHIERGNLIGATCSFKDTKLKNISEFNLIECGTNKITAVLRDGRWLTAKELVDINKNEFS